MHATLKPLLFAVMTVAALVACKRDAEPAPMPAEPASADAAKSASAGATDAVVPGTDASIVETSTAASGIAGNPNAPDWYDAKTFPGTFTADGASLTLAADGTYRMTVHAHSADADLESSGTWTLEADGQHLLLDPDSKSDPDRRYALQSADALQATEGGQVLRRGGAH